MVGEVLAGFTLTQEVGSGGTGTVYLAEHPRLEQRAVVKVFDGAAIADPARLELAFADARAAAGLEHPSIVEVLAKRRRTV